MKRNVKTRRSGEMRSQYDFTNAIRGKYAAGYAQGTNLVALSDEVARVFPDSHAVNEALRTLIRLGTARRARSARGDR